MGVYYIHLAEGVKYFFRYLQNLSLPLDVVGKDSRVDDYENIDLFFCITIKNDYT